MLEATRHPDQAHFLILDEMNLSHVERYFADILSTMESGEPIHLHAGPDERQGVPPDLPWPKNVFVVGTVNVDETTYMFSPKVLDRAHVLEFRAVREQMEALIREARRPDLALVDGLGSRFEAEFVKRTLEPIPDLEQKRLRAELTLLFDVLAAENYEFGYRTAVEITEFVRAHRRLAGEAWRFEDSVDSEILQKMLPRVHGSQRQIEGVLRTLAAATFETRSWSSGGDLLNAEQIREIASEAAKLTNREFDPLTAARYQGSATYRRSFDKIRRMLRQLDRNGFTSFAEA